MTIVSMLLVVDTIQPLHEKSSSDHQLKDLGTLLKTLDIYPGPTPQKRKEKQILQSPTFV